MVHDGHADGLRDKLFQELTKHQYKFRNLLLILSNGVGGEGCGGSVYHIAFYGPLHRKGFGVAGFPVRVYHEKAFYC